MKNKETSRIFEDLSPDAHFKEVLLAIGVYEEAEIANTIKPYYNSIVGYVINAGISEENILSSQTVGLVARGVSDIWNYGSGSGTLSLYFEQAVAQLVYKYR